MLRAALLAALYFVAAKLGLSLAFATAQVTTVWPPTGIAIAALLMFGWSAWPGIFVGAFLANVTADEPAWMALLIAGGNTLEAVVAVRLLRRFGFQMAFERVRDVAAFIGCAALVGPAVSATVGVGALALGGLVAWSDVVPVWLVWLVGDALGAMVVAPFLTAWFRREDSHSPFRRYSLEWQALLLLTIGFCVQVFLRHGDYLTRPLPYLVFPMLIWAAFRFGQAGVSTLTVIVSAVAIYATVNGLGPLAVSAQVEQNLIVWQIYVFVAAATSMLLAAATAERARLLRGARDQSARFAALLASVGDGIVSVGLDGRVLFANAAAGKLLGWKESRMAGRALAEVAPTLDEDGNPIPPGKRPFEMVLANGNQVTSDRISYVRRNGESFSAFLIVSPIMVDGRLVGVTEVFRDITQEKEAGRAKSEFVSVASHQLRTPLTTIRWYTELLRSGEGGKLTAKQRGYFRAISQSTERMSNLVRALLQVSRIERGAYSVSPRPLDLSRLAKDIVGTFETQIRGKRLRVASRFGRLPKVSLDPGITAIVFENLISNAVKYTLPGGSVHIALRREGKNALLTVSDTGCGIPEDQSEKIFTKFYRSDNARALDPDGTGLGLYIVRSIVERAGGTIGFTSSEGKGTTFRVTIPLRGMRSRAGTVQLNEFTTP